MASGKSAIVLALIAVAGGGYAAKKYYVDSPPSKVAKAYAETFPVRGSKDPADDAAIYVDAADPAKSMIVGADRTKGLAVYNLAGSELEFVELGEIENVDLRTQAKLGSRELALVATASSTTHSIHLFELSTEKPHLRALPGGTIQTDVQAQGLCLYRNPANGEVSIYMIGKERDPVREAKDKLAMLENERMAKALGDLPLNSDSPDGAVKIVKNENKEKKGKKEKRAKEAAAAGETNPADPAGAAAGETETATAADKTERKSKRDEAKVKEKVAKAMKEDPTAEEESLAKLAAQPKKQNRAHYAVQLKLSVDASGSIVATENRRIRLDGACEGAVVDDELGALYVSEEEVGVWKFNADGPKDEVAVGKLICEVEFPNPLRSDVEGLALYAGRDGGGYLVVCSQGSEDFVVLDRKQPHDYVGRFKIAAGNNVDGVENCDSITIVSGNLGGAFADGLVVAQDDYNVNTDGWEEKPNFKLVPWNEIAASLGL